ncbi:DUF2577 family protein [Sporosarcina sp. FSL K6-3508]|uniref:DUF2577 family protein n=1 Tax=Sporosarcina sp. FSL K6-3508 TaxID=2921557 RepID=UPI003159EC3B
MMQMQKRLKYEGSPYSQMVQAMRDIGRNETSTMEFGTIISAPPDIKLHIDHDENTYDKDDIYVSERLTAHKRKADIIGLVVASPMTANGQGPHTHELTSISLKNAEISYLDVLKEGDRVIVECDNERAKFTIVDRVVSYK